MTAIKALILSTTLAVAVVITGASGFAAGGTTAPTVRLKTISSRVNAKAVSVVIEATEPVAYLATRPDPLTVLVDLRSVASDGVVNKVAGSVKGPIAGVALEANNSLGLPGSRVRVALTQPMAYSVRSERNTIVVDFDRVAVPNAVAGPAASGPSDAMQALARPKSEVLNPILALGLGLSSPAPVLPAGAAALLTLAQAPPVQTAPATNLGSQDPARKYTGAPINFDLQDADLVGVLMLFQDISGLNVIIEPSIQGKVTMKLGQVPWDQALDAVLRQYKLGAVVEDTIVRIAPLHTLADEEVQRRKLVDEQALSGELVTIYPTLSYATVGDMQALVKNLLSSRGTVVVDARTNKLIVTDLPARLDAVSTLVRELDRAQPQVEIEARIVQTNKDYARALGIEWGTSAGRAAAVPKPTNLAFPNDGSLGGLTGVTQGPNATATAVNLGVAGASSAVGLALGSVGGAFNLDVALSAMEREKHGHLLSTPRVSTQNNVMAVIKQGKQIPVQTVSNNTTTTKFVDAALKLTVTPQITSSNTVIMKIILENSSADPAPFGITPSISTQSAETTVQVNDGETTVIGGIYSSDELTTNDRTPGLSRIPILKWLFKRDNVEDKSSELLIFITPRISK